MSRRVINISHYCCIELMTMCDISEKLSSMGGSVGVMDVGCVC